MITAGFSSSEVCRFELVLAEQLTARSMTRRDEALGFMIRWKTRPGAFVRMLTQTFAFTGAAMQEQDHRFSSTTRTAPGRQLKSLNSEKVAWRGFVYGNNVEEFPSPVMVTAQLLERGQSLLTWEIRSCGGRSISWRVKLLMMCSWPSRGRSMIKEETVAVHGVV